MDELLDLVNEKDEVIGMIERSEAHRNLKIIHREIAVLVVDNNNRLLLQQRSLSKTARPGYWEVSSSGHVAVNESPEKTAHRETEEELGFDLPLRFYKKELINSQSESRFMYFYYGEYKKEKVVVQKEEVEEVRFFSRDEFIELIETRKIGPISVKWCKEYWKIK